MKNLVKNTLYTSAAFGLVGLSSVTNALDPITWQPTSTADNLTDGGFIGTLDSMLGYIISLLYFIAVIFAIYGWFQILTASWDEEKVKKWKTTLINAVIWLIVIFLASQIISWIISLMTSGGSTVS